MIRNSAGFMLLDATAALFVTAVGVFGVIQMFMAGARTLDGIQEHNIAARIIQNEIETLRAEPFSNLQTGDRIPLRTTPPEREHLVNAQGWATIRNTPESNGMLKQATVTLAWTTSNGRRTERELTTLIANREWRP